MAGFRNIFIKSTFLISKFISPIFLQKISKQALIFPFYHSISNETLPHISHLYKIKNSKQFEKDLEFLLKYYQPISYYQFDFHLKNKKPLNKPSFLLSFDDGLSEFYHIIAPILLKKGIPAICFLNDAFIDNKDLFYRYKTSLLIGEYIKTPSIFKSDEYKTSNFIKYLQQLKYKDKHLLDKIASDIGFDFTTYLNKQKPYLTGDQINSLIEDGFYFGSHSFDHPEYQHLDINQQLKQTINSIDNICTRFNLNYRIFSFPFTDYNVSKQFFDRITLDGNIQYTFGTAGQKKDSATNNYQRIPLEMSKLTAREIINSELLYYITKEIIGNNTIKRE